jgi:hypothetical protein
MKPIDALFSGVKWECCNCGKPTGDCDCWIACECGHKKLRTEECSNQLWHISKQFAEELAEEVVADMAQGYRTFQSNKNIIGRLKRTIVRRAQPIIMATFDGVESAKREAVDSAEGGEAAE